MSLFSIIRAGFDANHVSKAGRHLKSMTEELDAFRYASQKDHRTKDIVDKIK
jgi:hypothetical protein